MARYFLHLRNGTDEILDPDGVDYVDMVALKRAVIAGARDVISGDIKVRGILDLRYWIDAEDESGRVVFTLLFTHAVSIVSDDI